MRRILVFLALILAFVAIQPARADTCAPAPIFAEVPYGDFKGMAHNGCDHPAPAYIPVPPGKIVGGAIIYLHANDEAKNSSLNNVLHAVRELEGKRIYPGEIFSFNREANLLQQTIPYDLGPDVRNNLVKAGGVCMVSTLLASAAHDAGLPFINERGKPIKMPVPHSRYYRYYHQVNYINDRLVPIVEAAVAIKKDDVDKPWETVQDMQFINTTGHTLVIHFEPSFTVYDLDLAQPFGLIQTEQTIRISLHAMPTGLYDWFSRVDGVDAN